MTSTQNYSARVLWVIGLVAFSLSGISAFAAESNRPTGGTPHDAQAFQQQRSDKTQQAQDLINKQPMTPQGNTGADLTGGRDSHLGPHESQDGQMQKKDMKGGTAGR